MSEITRKLATIERVKDIVPHDNADTLEIALIKGWRVIVQKDIFHKNDLVLYFEIDSFLPVMPQFEFLRKSSFRSSADIGEGFKIKTIKLRGEISQGLLAPLSDFPQYFAWDYVNEGWYAPKEIGYFDSPGFREGDDVTELMGVKKWEIPLAPCLKGDCVGLFPSFIPKTDEERVQNLNHWDIFGHAEDHFEATIKVDGTSMTVFRNKIISDVPFDTEFHVGVCSRNLEVKYSVENLYWKVAQELGLISALSTINMAEIAIQGELAGPGIGKNRAKLDKHGFYIFNIYDIEKKRYYTSLERQDFLNMLREMMGVKTDHVELLEFTDHIITDTDELMELYGQTTFNGEKIEGVVFKSVEHPNFSYKWINPLYLIKNEE